MAKVVLEIQIDATGNVTAIQGAEKALDGVEKSGDQAARSLEKVRQAQDRLATGAIIAGGAVLAGSYVAVQAASELEEAENKVTVVFGEQSAAIKSWAENSASDIGLARSEAYAAVGTFGTLFSTLGMGPEKTGEMSKGMTELAADIASFNDIPTDEALLKLQAGLVGEVEPLRRVGILLSMDAVKAKAMEMGIAGANAELTEAQKVQARYALILEQAAVQQGDFKRTSDSIANSQKIMKAEIEDATASIGQALQPAMKALLDVAKPIAKTLGDLADTKVGKWAIVAGAGMGALALAGGVAVKAMFALAMMKTTLGLAMGKNTIALNVETAALGRNTVAQNLNAGAAARAGGARGIGAAGRVASVVTGGLGVKGLLGTAVGGIGAAGGAAAIATSVAAGVGVAIAGWNLGEVIGRAIQKAGWMGKDIQQWREAIDANTEATKEVAAAQKELAAMTGEERKAYVAAKQAERAKTDASRVIYAAGEGPANIGAAAGRIRGVSVGTRAQKAQAAEAESWMEMSARVRREGGNFGRAEREWAERRSKTGRAGAAKAVEKLVVEVKGDSIAAQALAKELSQHPDIIAAINERIERAGAP